MSELNKEGQKIDSTSTQTFILKKYPRSTENPGEWNSHSCKVSQYLLDDKDSFLAKMPLFASTMTQGTTHLPSSTLPKK